MNIKTIILDNKFIEKNSYNYLFHLFDYIYKDLHFLENEYPNFRYWYFDKVIKELLNTKLDNRKIIVKLVNSDLAGVSILKDTFEEKKICTLRITDKYKGFGIGTELLTHSIDLLNEEKPLITVSSNRLYEFNKLLNNFDFKLNRIYSSLYKKGLSEYSFNSEIKISSYNDYYTNKLRCTTKNIVHAAESCYIESL